MRAHSRSSYNRLSKLGVWYWYCCPHPEFGVLQLLRGDTGPAVQLKTGDKVLAQVKIKYGISFQDFLNYAICMAQLLRSNLARIEQHAHTLHGEVLALGALEVPQLAQAEDRYTVVVVKCNSTELFSIWNFVCSMTERAQQGNRLDIWMQQES